jgi:hypothetical protein
MAEIVFYSYKRKLHPSNPSHIPLPPNPTPDLLFRSTDPKKTLGIVGTPHGYSIAKLWSTKTRWIKRNRRISAKNTPNPRTTKPKKPSPISWISEGNQREKNHEGFMHTSPVKSPRKRPRNLSMKNANKRLRKSQTRKIVKNSNKPWGTTSNHLYIPQGSYMV